MKPSCLTQKMQQLVPNSRVNISWSWHLKDYHQNSNPFVTRFYQVLLFLAMIQLVNNCCSWLHLMSLVRFLLHLLLLQHQVTLLPLHLLETIKIAFEEGHPTPNLVPSVTIVIGLGILSTVAGSCMADLHVR